MTKKGEEFVGHTALVGITYLNCDKSVREHLQYHGTVVRVDEDGWLVLARPKCEGEFRFPPVLHVAKGGHYRLKSTGEEVVNPEFIGTFTVTPRKRNPEGEGGDLEEV